ncbi:MAG: insulinase family protein [Geothrix sp.]|nr:insulinase family protein [Geothrix sp.]
MRGLPWLCLAPALVLQAQPRPQSFTLPNGLRVVHLEDHEHPLVRARLYLRVESGDTPADRQGLPLLFHRLLDGAETADLKAGDLDRILADAGIQLRSSLEAGGFTWELVARSRDQDRAMGLLADRLLRPLFDPTLLEAERQAFQQQLEHPEASPHRRLRQGLTRDLRSRPTPDSLKTMTLQDLLAFRARAFRPDRAILILHGDLGLEQAKRLVLLNLGSWATQAAPPGRPPSAPAPAPSLPLEGPRIAAPGAGIRVQALAPRPGDLAPEAAELLCLLVPGDPSLAPVRVAMEEDGLVATLDGGGDTSGSVIWFLLLRRLEVLRQRGFTQAELDSARTAWLARRSLDSLHPEAQMARALAEVLGRGGTEEPMRAMSLDALNANLRNWLDPANLHLGASGDPEGLKSIPIRGSRSGPQDRGTAP